MNPHSEFTCLYTSQKQKKSKTWQDGHIRFFHTNSKIVLYDSKYSVLDSTFNKGPAVKPGDDLEMDRHLITVEEFTNSIQGNAEQILAHGAPIQARTKIIPINRVVQPQLTPISSNTSTVIQPKPYTQSDIKRKKWRAPFANTNMRQQIEQSEAVESLDDIPFDFTENDLNDIDNLSAASPSAGSIPMPTHRESPIMDRPSQPVPAPKRRKVGLSRGSVLSNSAQLSILSHRAPSTQLEFPNAARCTNFVGKNSGPKRSISLGARFSSTNQYKDGMSYLIYDNLQVMIVEIALALWAIKTTSNAKDGDAIDKFYRAKGIHMHSQAVLRKRGVDPYAGFEKYGRRGSGSSDYRLRHELMPTAGTQQAATLTLSNKEHHSKYSKDDLWVVSRTQKFDSANSFFARSVFYGPSGSDVEICCLSTKDSNVARELFSNSSAVCAIRLFNAVSEFMMLDNLSDGLTKSPLLPVVLNYIPPELIKTSKTAIFKAPTRVPEKTGCIVLTEDDGIDVEMEVQDTVSRFNLNQDQATVLRNFALTVVRAPSWGSKSQEPPPPILLVHGVFGAGKSFLIAVLIIFADTIISKARPVAPEERSCRFLVASMTNVAVDRVLTALLDLGYTDFVRVGSLKKVARRILPYTAQSNAREDVKELQLILQEDNLTPSERHNVRVAIKRFQKDSNRDIVDGAKVVGATCVASTFEALDNMSFPIVILDEASQLLEPMSLVPLCRAAGEKLIMVGDPLQLSPPVTTKVDNLSANTGYTRTLFDRAVEMGIKPVKLKTQYRCHPRIASICSALFYSNELKAGMSPQDRAPLVSGLPTLSFIDNNGSEIQNQRSKSFTNPAEVRLVVDIVQRLLSLNVSSSDIGVISLYKSQAEAIQSSLEELTKVSGLNGGGVQISTVDAFQGSEKEVIIVSTVRTESIGFIDNRQRVNVALSRSKRHLFLVGNSRLLSSNQLWGQIINTHCAESIDGVTRGDHFLSHLKTLVPIPKTPAPGLLEDSDTEDEDELPRPNGTVHETEHYSDKEGSEEEVYPEPPLRTGSRKYTLYLADETDSDNSHEEERLSRQSRSNGKPRHVSHSSEGQWQHPSTQADPNVLNVAMRRPEDIVMASASPPFVRQHITESASSMLNCESVGRPELTANLRKPVQIIYIPAVAAQEPVDQSHEVEELNQKETVVWEMTEDDYEAFDEAMIRDEDAVPDATENTLKDDLAPIVTASRSHISSLSPPLAPAANVRAQPQPSLGAMDSESVIDCCESQRLEDLEDLFSLTQTHVAPNHVTSTNTRLSTCLVDTVESTASLREVSTGLSLEQTDSHETERDTAGVRIEQGEEQDLALLMNDFE